MPTSSLDLSQQLLQFGGHEEMGYPEVDRETYDEGVKQEVYQIPMKILKNE